MLRLVCKRHEPLIPRRLALCPDSGQLARGGWNSSEQLGAVSPRPSASGSQLQAA
jgi:hypothetical protein